MDYSATRYIEDMKTSHLRRDMYNPPENIPQSVHHRQISSLGIHHMQGLRPHLHNISSNLPSDMHHPLNIRPNHQSIDDSQPSNHNQTNSINRMPDWHMNHNHTVSLQPPVSMMNDHRTYQNLRDVHASMYNTSNYQIAPQVMSHSLHLSANPSQHYMHENSTVPNWPPQMYTESSSNSVASLDTEMTVTQSQSTHVAELRQEEQPVDVLRQEEQPVAELRQEEQPVDNVKEEIEINQNEKITNVSIEETEPQDLCINENESSNDKHSKVSETFENKTDVNDNNSLLHSETTNSTINSENHKFLKLENVPDKPKITNDKNDTENNENISSTDETDTTTTDNSQNSTIKAELKISDSSNPEESTVEHVCPECGKECANKGVLGRHLKYQHGEKKYQCDECDFKASRKDTFAKHMKLNHLSQERKKGPHLSELDRGRVIALKEVGWTYPSIADHVGCSATTCKNVWRKFIKDKSHKKAKRKSSHRCTNPIQDAQILQVATLDPNKSAVDIVNELNLNICAKTVRRRLNKLGLFSRMLTVQDHLSVNQMRFRYEFACLYRDDRVYTADFWKRVVFADEKTFDVDKNGRVRVWHPKCTSFNQGEVSKPKNTGKFGSGVNFFACYNGEGFAQLHELPPKFGSEDYKNLLRDMIIPSLRMKYPLPHQIYYVQDKSPIHTASNVAAFFRSIENITVINLPAKGSDMNPLEDIWRRMTRRIKINQSWTIDEFRACIYSSWQWCRQHDNYFEQLSAAMPERITSIVASEGRWAKY